MYEYISIRFVDSSCICDIFKVFCMFFFVLFCCFSVLVRKKMSFSSYMCKIPRKQYTKPGSNCLLPSTLLSPDIRRYYAHLLTPCLFSAPRMGYNHQYAPYFLSEYSGQSANVSRVLDTLLHGYDKRLRPKYKGRWGDVNGCLIDENPLII